MARVGAEPPELFALRLPLPQLLPLQLPLPLPLMDPMKSPARPPLALFARVFRVVAVGAVAVAVYLIVRRLDFHALGDSLRHARPQLLVLALVTTAGNFWFRAVMWRLMLGGGHQRRSVPSVTRLFQYTVAAFAASAVTPARAGELLRLWLLRRHHQIPYSLSVGTAMAEKLLDALAMLALVGPLVWLVPPLPAWTTTAVVGLAIVGVSILVVAGWLARSTRTELRVVAFLRQISVLREPATFAKALGAALGAAIFDVATLWLALNAFHISRGFAGVSFVLLVTNAALAIPSTPGSVGTLEAGAVLALDVLSVPRAQSVAFALGYHALQLGPLLVFALFNLRLMLGAAALTPADAKDATSAQVDNEAAPAGASTAAGHELLPPRS